jgi:hypothetical protein
MSEQLFNDGKRVSVPVPEELANYRIEAWHQYSHAMSFAIIDYDEEILTGSVKWDGCSNWNSDACLHFCEREQFVHLSKLMELCFDFTAKNLPTFDHSA